MENYLSFYCKFIGILMIIGSCLSDILVIKNGSNKTIEIIGDLPALFGPNLPIGGLKGRVVYALPHDACEPLPKPPIVPNYKGAFIALVRRYNCTFVEKVLNAQVAGYQAAIVRNVGSNSVEMMSGNHDTELVKIPSVFIGQDDGILIEESFQYNRGYSVLITDDQPFNIQNYLLPFAITIGICFILMLTLMLVKCIRDYRRTRRHRLSSRALKKLPTHKFKKGDPYECCAVCLEDYVDNDKLRILPCSHAYHTKCIDPWLTKNRRVCPVCKRKVIIGDERPSDIDSDSDDETAPLINSEAGTQGGTFVPQRENPFQEAERLGERRRQMRNGRYSRLDESDSEDEVTETPERSAPPTNQPAVTESSSEREEESANDDAQVLVQPSSNLCPHPSADEAEDSTSVPSAGDHHQSPPSEDPEVAVEGIEEEKKSSTPKNCIV